MKADREIKVRCSACGHLTRIPTVTNADRIRSMTDEELARFIANERGRFCDFKDPSDEEYPKVLYWLKQECES